MTAREIEIRINDIKKTIADYKNKNSKLTKFVLENFGEEHLNKQIKEFEILLTKGENTSPTVTKRIDKLNKAFIKKILGENGEDPTDGKITKSPKSNSFYAVDYDDFVIRFSDHYLLDGVHQNSSDAEIVLEGEIVTLKDFSKKLGEILQERDN